MPSLGSILHIASTALRAQQEAINVVAHNVANASTEGYSRQRPVLGPKPLLETPQGIFGTGVEVGNVQRIRDEYLDVSLRREVASLGEHQVRSGILGQVETILVEPGDDGIGNALDEFFSAWSALASDPSSTNARIVVRDRAEHLVDRMRTLNGEIDRLRQDTQARLAGKVQRVNELTEEIAHLNQKIVTAEVGLGTAGDLRDARDLAIDELASLVPVQVLDWENGSMGIVTSGISLVDGIHANELEVRAVAGTVGVGVVGHPGLLPDQGGQIGGMLALLNTEIPDVVSQLDQLAEAIVTEINAIHQTGTDPAGNTGVDFFDPAGTTAASIALSADVLAGLDAISAGAGGPSGEYLAGANDIALAISGLRDTASPLLGSTYGEHFGELTSDVGFSVRSSLDLAEVHGSLVQQAETRRASYSGVSTDEELVHLIEYQTAYAAAARVVTVANEMLETLVRM